MAETLNLGTDGNWAVKKDSLLAYNSENRNFKPLPFSFSRASSATVVDKDGLIEIVGIGEPRIDFKDDAKGALLLEPQRTNLLIYSEDFSNPAWNKINSTINSNQTISPKGDLTADLLSATTTTGSYFIDVLFVTPAQKYTCSIFAKKSNSDYFAFIIVDGANVIRQYYNVSDGTVGITNNSGSPIVENIKIENYGNGWYRCSLTIQALNNAVEVRNYVIQNDGIATAPIGSEIFLWGIQSEQGSYATSYIPTQGAISTRVADVCSRTVPSGIIGQTEGTVYFEGSSDTIGGSTNLINFNFSANSVVINRQSTGVIRALINTASTILLDSSPVSGIFKVAIGYKNGDSVLYVNGTLAASSTNSFTFATALTQVNLGTGIAYFAAVNQSKCNQALLYNTRLSNSELAALTAI